MTNVVSALWPRLQVILDDYSMRFGAVDPTLILDINCTQNEVFLLRGYLAIKKNADGDELAITIDVQSDDDRLNINSDACADDGRIFAVGPSASIPSSDGQLSLEAGLDRWIEEFEKFLLKNEKFLLDAVGQLS